MKILILGAYCSCNLGDSVICECVAHILRKQFPEAHITIKDFINRDRLAPRTVPDEHSMKCRRIRERIRRIGIRIYPGDLIMRGEEKRVEANRSHIEEICSMDADVVVIAGGQLFMDRYALFLEAFIARFGERNIPVIINACGTGPNGSIEIAARLKAALMNTCVKKISCRDDVDLVNARYLEAGKRAEATFDPALIAGSVYGEGAVYAGDSVVGAPAESQAQCGISPREAQHCIGLGVKEPDIKDYKQTVAFWQGIIGELEKSGKSWQFFTNGDPIDLAFAAEIISTMPHLAGREEELLRACDRRPEELIATVRSYDGLISFRLHSHIVACAWDIPTVAVVWDGKLPIFFEKIGCPGRCVTVKEEPQKVLELLERAGKEGYDKRRLLGQREYAVKWLMEAVEEAIRGAAQEAAATAEAGEDAAGRGVAQEAAATAEAGEDAAGRGAAQEAAAQEAAGQEECI